MDKLTKVRRWDVGCDMHEAWHIECVRLRLIHGTGQ